MSRATVLAVALAVLAIALSLSVSQGIYENLPQLEDEYAYRWQAQILAHGDLKIPSPPQANKFIIPFVIDRGGERFGKYPLGWPMLLSFGAAFGLMRWVNPLIAGLAVWWTYRLGEKLLGQQVGLLAAGLTAVSPFFLTYSGSILSHTWGLTLSLIFAVSWLDISGERDDLPGWLPTLTAGASLGVLALSRPWTAFGVALPFGLRGIFQMWRGSTSTKRKILAAGLITLAIGSLHFIWQYALTGNPLGNPYLLWWPYDKIGFGPGVGVAEGGHTLRQGWLNTRQSLKLLWSDLFGWGWFTWALPLIGLWTARRNRQAWLVGAVFPALVGGYLAYWVSGPRYFYEGLFSLTILSAAGVAWFLGDGQPSAESGKRSSVLFPPSFLPRFRFLLTITFFAALLIFGTLPYAPARIRGIQSRYGFTQAALEAFRTPEAQELAPALVLIHPAEWKDYGVYLNLEDPYLTTPFIFAWAAPAEAGRLENAFPGRTVYRYNPQNPGIFVPLGER